jgi:hypothetical protein
VADGLGIGNIGAGVDRHGVLSILEISLSFDNAVVNATVLAEMDDIWQRRPSPGAW